MNLAVTTILGQYKIFSRQFWLEYKALESLMDPTLFESIKLILMKSKRIDPKYLKMINVEDFELKKAEIDADWRLKSEEAKQTGTTTHEMLHNMLCTSPHECQSYGIPTDQYQVLATEDFMKSDGLFPEFRMEVKLDDAYTLVGVADLIIKSGNRVKIIDFKTSDKIETKARYDMGKKHSKKFAYPLSSVDDCNLNEYTLQLSIYAWMLKQLNPNLEIVGLEVYHIQDMKLKKIYPVLEMKAEVEKLIPWHLKAVKLKKATDECKEIIY